MKQDAASATPPVEAGSDAMAVPQPNTPSLQHSNTPPRIPDHDLLKKIGGGSYGEVWLARNVIGTHHAVKIIYRSAFDNDRPFEREFEGIKNAEPISRSIPGLVHILQVGRNDEAGYFYYVMELADSPEVREQKSEVREQKSTKAKARPSDLRPLTSDFSLYTPRTLSSELKQRGALPVEECVQLGLTLTAALHALHEKGLVHRDIKPSNITFVNGEPKLADIGLMASTGEARSFVGTAGFIPPEGPGTPQADLYSLGKVLYELSTGKDRQEFPELPAELIQSRSSRREEAQTSKSEIGNRKSERDQSLLTSAATALLELNAILVKACETDFRKRYGTAQQMHDDLALLQRGHSIRRKRAVERRFVLAKQMSVAVAAFTMLTIGVWSLSKRFDRAGIESSGTANLQAYNEFRLGRFSGTNELLKD